jgi:hypothetical protein
MNSFAYGLTKSCGCFHSESARTLSTKHGLRYTRQYDIWYSMIRRCSNPSDKGYKNYGARGITICHEWLDLKKFYDWSITHGYNDSLSIDRIDNNKGYSPDNCRWGTDSQQARNTRVNRRISFNGKEMCLSEWAEKLGLSSQALSRRLRKWPVENALTIPRSTKHIHNVA